MKNIFNSIGPAAADDDDELYCGMADRQKTFSLFPAGTIVRDPHHSESPTRREQGLNLRRT